MVIRTSRRKCAPRQGSACLELAVLAPFLAFLFVIAIDYGRVFYFAMIVENCARNGAMYAANYPTSYPYGSVYAAATADASNLNPALQSTDVTTMYSTTAGGPYTSTTPLQTGFVQVTVQWQFTTITHFPGLPTTVELSRSVEMEIAPNMVN